MQKISLGPSISRSSSLDVWLIFLLSSDSPASDSMEIEVVVVEYAHGDADDVAVTEEADGTDIPAGGGEAEAAKAGAAAEGEETGDRADGPEVTGASNTPAASDPAATAASDPEEPPAGAYLKAGDD